MKLIDAVTMARDAGVNPKRFRAALRKAELAWHIPGHRWLVRHGGGEHQDMVTVLKGIGRA